MFAVMPVYLWRLGGHLDTSLQNRDGKIRVR